MAVADVYVVYDRSGTLSEREAKTDEDVVLKFESAEQIVAIFVKRTEGEPPQEFWDEFSGNSMYSITKTEKGIVINAYDDTPEKTRTKEYDADTAWTAWRTLDNKLAAAIMGGGATMDVVDNGQGSYYEEKLADARLMVGYPS